MTILLRRPEQPRADASAGYVPGACNIGLYEVRRRRAFGLAGLAVAGLGAAALVAIGAPPAVRLSVALPLIGGMFSLLQARRRFCAGFAIAGILNFGEDDAGRRPVEDPVARRADLAAAARMGLDAVLVGLPITAVFVLLPV